MSLVFLSLFFPSYYLTIGHGHSMEQYGIYDGMKLRVYQEEAKVGDIVSFRCVTDKCPNQNMTKVLKDEKDGCYWFQGRDDQWYNEKGEIRKSLDSRVYGWVCKEDVIINGVIR